MGWCHEFGCQIVDGCDHPMTADETACTCASCGVVCTGRFGACPDVWARGPQGGQVVDVLVGEPAPEPEPDAAAVVMDWLRVGFDDMGTRIHLLSDRLAREEASSLARVEAQTSDLNVSLAELEGCAAQLRNEAVALRGARAALTGELPGLVGEAVGPVVAAGVARAVGDLRAAVAELGAALAEALPAAVADAVASSLGSRVPGAEGAQVPAPAPVEAADPVGDDLDPLSQLHEAQDEAADWLSTVVEQAVGRVLARHFDAVTGPVGSTGPAAPAKTEAAGAPSEMAGPATAFGPRRPATAFGPRRPATAPADARPLEPVLPPAPSDPPGAPVAPPDAATSAETEADDRAAAEGDQEGFVAGTAGPTAEATSGADGRPASEAPAAVAVPADPGANEPAEPGVGEEPAGPGGLTGPAGSGGGQGPAGTGGMTGPAGSGGRAGPAGTGGMTALAAPAGSAGHDAVAGASNGLTGGEADGPDGTPVAGTDEQSLPGPGGVAAVTDWYEASADDEQGERQSAVACVLPGVAVGPTLALGVTAALGRARLRRRRRRPAGAPSAGLFRRDPRDADLTRRLERFGLARRGVAFSPNGHTPEGRNGLLVAAAEADDREVAVDLAARPLTIVGPGSADAGRALITTFLAQTPPRFGLVVSVDGVLPDGPSFPGLERVVDLATALDLLEEEVDRRERLSAPEVDLADLRSRHPDQELPLVVLVTAAVAPDDAGRLHRVLERGRRLGVSALGVGCDLEGAAVVVLNPGAVVRAVHPDGRADGLRETRLFTLCSSAAGELLGLLRAARTDDEAVAPGDVEDEPFPVLVTSEPAPIHVQVLGAYRLEIGGQEIRSGLRAKARELLAFYLIHPEGTTLDAATEALWPEADTGRGSEWFWTALGNLRSLLRNATGIRGLKVIEREGDRYRVEPVFDVDLWRFQQALPSRGATTGDPDWTENLQAAADHYRGELLINFDWVWAEVPREDLRRRAVDVLVSLAATRLVAGDARAALDALFRALDVDPVAEQLYRRIMRLHAKHSGPEEVESTFRRLEARLGELDLEPTPESTRLVAELCG